MHMTRRQLFSLAFGAAQVALLSRFGLRPGAAAGTAGPTKLLAIYVDGGLHWESFFTPLTRAGVQKFIPAPAGGFRPWGYLPEQVGNFDRSAADLDAPGPARKLRGPIYWNWDRPADDSGAVPGSAGAQQFRPYGYIWANPAYKLYERAVLLVGADQNTASHQSGRVASLCGVAGATFRAPAVQAVIANFLAARFPDRPLPNVSLGGPVPVALGLPSRANPTALTSRASVEPTLSDRRDSAWKGLRARAAAPDLSFAGEDRGGTVPLTAVDEAILEAARARRGRSSSGTDALLEQLYDTYKGASRTIARDILSILEAVKGMEHLQRDPAYPASWSACIGKADQCASVASMGPHEFALQLLKSDLCTCVTLRATSIANSSFDTHSGDGPQTHANHLHIAMEQIGRVIAEMSLTPTSAGRTLLDDTLVYVFSEFGRTFPKQGSDHHPANCALLVGGGVLGNQMLGGYNEAMNGSPMGAPVPIIEESGERAVRPANAQDIAATVLRAFSLQAGKDYFIPGGYGYFDGALRAL